MKSPIALIKVESIKFLKVEEWLGCELPFKFGLSIMKITCFLLLGKNPFSVINVEVYPTSHKLF